MPIAIGAHLGAFGAGLWSKLQQQPFGALGKRELELSILDAATKAGLLQETPDAVASSLSLSFTKANSYLTVLALRRPPLSDQGLLEVILRSFLLWLSTPAVSATP